MWFSATRGIFGNSSSKHTLQNAISEYGFTYVHECKHVFKGCQTKSSRDIRRHFRLHSDESAPIAVVQHLIPHCVSALSGMYACMYVCMCLVLYVYVHL